MIVHWYSKLALIIAAVGAINWGLSVLNFELIGLIFGSWAPVWIATVIYVIIGIAGIVALFVGLKELVD